MAERELRACVLVDAERPKVSDGHVESILKKAGIEHSSADPSFGIVVGGDGLFSYQGRKLSIPLLFVGTKSTRPTDSKARLAEVYLNHLEAALREMKAGKYGVVKHRRLEVSIDRGRFKEEIFTDVSLEKGADSNCIRYTLEVEGKGNNSFTDSAVSNGVVITTSAGSTGYYSYLDKLDRGDHFEPEKYSVIDRDQVGVCHIAPTFTSRNGTAKHPLRYTVAWGTSFRILLMRDADAHLFGVGSRKGLKINTDDVIDVGPSKNTTNVIRLASPHAHGPRRPSLTG